MLFRSPVQRETDSESLGRFLSRRPPRPIEPCDAVAMSIQDHGLDKYRLRHIRESLLPDQMVRNRVKSFVDLEAARPAGFVHQVAARDAAVQGSLSVRTGDASRGPTAGRSWPAKNFTVQQARNLVWELQEAEIKPRFLIHDRDCNFLAAFEAEPELAPRHSTGETLLAA